MPTFAYKLTESLFRRSSLAILKKAVADPTNYINQCRENQKKAVLPLEKLHKKFLFDENQAGEAVYYAVHSHSANPTKQVVLYFFGGGYMMAGDKGDFEFAQEMADKTGAEVWLVWYPLFPDTTPEKIITTALNVYQEALKTHSAHDILFFGLSSGASLSLATCVHIIQKKIKIPQPEKLILVSPTVRIPLTVEQYSAVQDMGDSDCMFPPEYMQNMGKFMDKAGINCSAVPWFKSPIHYNWKGIREMLVIFGGNEFLSVQLEEIKQKCIRDNVKLNTIVGKDMMHTWIVAGILPEAKDGRKMVYDYIKGNAIT